MKSLATTMTQLQLITVNLSSAGAKRQPVEPTKSHQMTQIDEIDDDFEGQQRTNQIISEQPNSVSLFLNNTNNFLPFF